MYWVIGRVTGESDRDGKNLFSSQCMVSYREDP